MGAQLMANALGTRINPPALYISESLTVARIATDIASRVADLPDSTVLTSRRLRRRLSREYRADSPATMIAVALQLLRHQAVPRWFTYEILGHHPAAMQLSRSSIEDLGKGIGTWGDVDAFACYVAGPALRAGALTITDIQDWTASHDRWWRRAALVSTVPLNNTARGGKGDADRTLLLCDLLRNDRDDMVVKAMSWSLRELAKKEPRRVEAYLAERQADLAPRVLREVRNKLSTGLKNPRRPPLRPGA
jgi:3-methyladenine DNA glycosylase AlkD